MLNINYMEALPVGTVYNKNKPLSPRVVVAPQGPDLVLATHILKRHNNGK